MGLRCVTVDIYQSGRAVGAFDRRLEVASRTRIGFFPSFIDFLLLLGNF